MPSYKLQYFNFRGSAELSRLLFTVAGKDFDDDRLKDGAWAAAKPRTPYGQLPVLVVDKKTQINQSAAISRFLAREFGLYGKNNMENTKCDIVLETINDLTTEMFKFMFEKDEAKKANLCKEFKSTAVPKFTKFMTKTLIDNGGKFLVGSELTIADIALFDTLDKITSYPALGDACLKDCSDLKAHFQKVKTLPKIQKYLEKRPKTDF